MNPIDANHKGDTPKQEALLLKEDLLRVEKKLGQGFKDHLKRLIVLMFGFSSLIVTLIKLL